MNYEIEEIFSATINGLPYKDENTFYYVKEAIESFEEHFGFDINSLPATVLIHGKLFETVNKIFKVEERYDVLEVEERYDVLVKKAVSIMKEDNLLFNEIHSIECGS